jgi:hypothetical protein
MLPFSPISFCSLSVASSGLLEPLAFLRFSLDISIVQNAKPVQI